MAYTSIHPITATVNKALSYIMDDKTKLIETSTNEKNKTFVVEKDNLGSTVIYKTIISTLNCSAKDTGRAFRYIRDIHSNKRRQRTKLNGESNLAWHCIQSFEGIVDKKIANEIGKKLAEECFSEFQCVITTHTNTENTHNHIIFNAWEIGSGRKYNDCESTYRKIRNISDRLCKEYGLPVLEDTKDFKLVKWQDENGKKHSFEPTKRKNSERPMEYANANDYRNTNAYEDLEAYKKTNREVIKEDIEKIIPHVNSYEELLQRLADIGYEINAKKTNGDWRKHISFKTPGQEKAIRDYRLGEEYTREAITERIEESFATVEHIQQVVNQKENQKVSREVEADGAHPEVLQGDYISLGNTIKSIEGSYNAKRALDKSDYAKDVVIDIGRDILHDLKSKHVELKGLRELPLVETRSGAGMMNEVVLKNKRSQYLLDCINANIKAIQFVEQNKINSFDEICKGALENYNKRQAVSSEIKKIDDFIQKAEKIIKIKESAGELKSRIAMMTSADYNNYERAGDEVRLKRYEEALVETGFSDAKKFESLMEVYNKYRPRYDQLSGSIRMIDERLREYDNCVRVLDRIDKEKQVYAADIKEYHEIKQRNKKTHSRER